MEKTRPRHPQEPARAGAGGARRRRTCARGWASECELLKIVTTGDRQAEWSLEETGRRRAFSPRELEEALLRGEADVAVHSAKDLPGEIGPGPSIAGYLPAGRSPRRAGPAGRARGAQDCRHRQPAPAPAAAATLSGSPDSRRSGATWTLACSKIAERRGRRHDPRRGRPEAPRHRILARA